MPEEDSAYTASGTRPTVISARPSLLGFASVLGGLAVWAAVAAAGWVSPIVLPSPLEVISDCWSLLAAGYAGQSLWLNCAASLLRLTEGFGLAVLFGVPIGVAMGLSWVIQGLLDPLIEAYRPLPALSYYTLLILWLGIGESSKVAVLALAGLPPIVLAAVNAVKSVRRERIEGALSLGLSAPQLIRYVVLPSCLPALLSSMRVAFGFSYTTLVAAEMIASTSGLGWMVYRASQYAAASVVIVGLLIMGGTGILVDAALNRLQQKLVPWARHA